MRRFLLLLFAAASCSSVLVSASNNNNNNNHERGGINMGTTIVAMKSKQGVIVGADTRTSQGTMVSNRFAEKISTIYQQGSLSCVLCRSGSAADTQVLADQARWKFQDRALTYGMTPTLSQIAHWLKSCIRSGTYMASLLCVGYEESSTSGGKIVSISQSGAMMEEPMCAAAGSGSSYILALMDNAVKEGLMEEQDAIDFVASLIHSAMARDGASGGMARIVVMNSDGMKEMIVPPPGESLEQKQASPVLLKGFQVAAAK
jgi:20S proteasome subunit beta 1